MHCYFCQRAGVSTWAVAVCRSCGAACCIDHLEERAHAGRAAGMLPMLPPRVEMLCARCVALQSSHLSAASRSAAENVNVSSPLKMQPAPALPEAREAISAVENLLGLEPSASIQAPRKGWRRFFSRSKRLF